jgi:hypothetical protein
MKQNKLVYLLTFIFIFTSQSCFNDLNTVPLDTDISTSADAFKDPAAYKRVLAKLYAGLATTGQQGPSGKGDIGGIDEGFGQYLRMLFYHQSFTTEEAMVLWNDQTIARFHEQSWTSDDGFIFAFYSRIYYQISICNEFLRQTSEEKLNERNVDNTLKGEIKLFRAEARFLRALSYYHALDHFRNVPFVTELDKIGSFFPKQGSAKEIYSYIESELKAIETELSAPLANEYGRADVVAAWTLLSKLYLNAEVYVSEKKYKESLTYAEKVINSGYKLDPEFKNLFLADNHTSKEIIFPVVYDGINKTTYGGVTFLIKAGIGGAMNAAESGVNEGWGGIRTTKELVKKFPADLTGTLVSFNPGIAHQRILIPGSFQAKPFDGVDSGNSLTSPEKNKIYEGYRYLKAGDEFVVLKNPSSTLSGKLGDNGQDGTLEVGGENIKVTSEGFYKISIDLNTNKYSLSKENWSLVGTSTGGTNIPLTYDSRTGYLKAKIQLAQGGVKFTNGTIVLGDNGADAILDVNGADLKINGGGYEFFLDFDRRDYTYQINSTDFDRRALFYNKGQKLEIDDPKEFTNGYAVVKFKNIKSDGTPSPNTVFPDTDFPMFRLGEVYLTAAEAILRDNGDKNKALEYFNTIRKRAYGGSSIGDFTSSQLDLNSILDERARELYWECTRRTDLVRFGQFTDGSYLWAWKGGVKEGKTVEKFRNVFPIPASDLIANPNLKQNDGY